MDYAERATRLYTQARSVDRTKRQDPARRRLKDVVIPRGGRLEEWLKRHEERHGSQPGYTLSIQAHRYLSLLDAIRPTLAKIFTLEEAMSLTESLWDWPTYDLTHRARWKADPALKLVDHLKKIGAEPELLGKVEGLSQAQRVCLVDMLEQWWGVAHVTFEPARFQKLTTEAGFKSVGLELVPPFATK